MADFHTTIAQSARKPMSDSAQEKAGKPLEGTLSAEHRAFLKSIRELIERKEIDPYTPKTFIRMEVYGELSEEWQDKTDLALMNIADLLKQLYELYIRTDTPNESPQYQTMIEQLFEMKQRIEQHHDVFKF
jgi:methylaspartate ammonia-lyase